MSKPIFVLSFTGDQNPDTKKEPCLPNLDFWIFHMTIKKTDIYVKFLPGHYREMINLIEKCDYIQPITEYMGFDESAQDGRFEFKKEFINLIKFKILAEKCFQDQKH